MLKAISIRIVFCSLSQLLSSELRVSSQNLERNVGMWEGPWKCGIFSKNVGNSGKM
jgi:hypothetical protein